MAKKTLPVAKSTSVSDAPYKPSSRELEERRRWKAEDALRVCEQYEKNKSDKSLMKDVAKLAKEKMNDLKKVLK